VTPHFDSKELACRCGCGMLPSVEFMAKVERLRMRAGFPMPVSSAARCPAWNAQVSGTGTTGPHTTGRAIDLAVSHSRALELIRLALQMDFTGIGVNQKGPARFLHLDDLPNKDGQPRPHIWSY
jgi:zinc D-Ala-D-Ala carboxypeptidase